MRDVEENGLVAPAHLREPASLADPSQPGGARKRVRPANPLDLSRWRDYEDLVTDSLWVIGDRDRSGSHAADYHGNFVPQIPHQAIRRFTAPGELVIDPFAGSGTTLIECRRLGRDGIGVELNPSTARMATERVETEASPSGARTTLLVGDSADTGTTAPRVRAAMAALGHTHAHLALLHPPYHNAVRFSESAEDLSCCPDLDAFLARFDAALDLVDSVLAARRYLVLVIGDLYADSEWLPLGFRCMERVLRRDYGLKGIVVKDMQGNRAKRGQERLWRYRALVGGFFVFKHEYVMYFVRPERRGEGCP